MARTTRIVSVLGAAGFAVLIGSCASQGANGPLPDGAERTRTLYARHCAACHGEDGGGDGPAAPILFPRPRDFGLGRFRLVRTDNGVPTDDDLAGCLSRGMPGAAMPSFAWMPGTDLLALARYVRCLSVDRMAARLVEKWETMGRTLSPLEARDVAQWRMTPGEPVQVPNPVAVDDVVLSHGRELFGQRCAACHGVDGEGQTPDRAWAEFEGLYWARDLRRGVLKGGARHVDLARRILAGMPGVAMPPVRFDDPADAAAVVAFVQSLLPGDADRRGVQRRQQVRAQRVAGVAIDPGDVAWEGVPVIEAELMALACRADCVDRATVQAMHDGLRIAVRLGWDDPSRDDSAIGGLSRFADQCAVQISDQALPPLFGMGAHDAPVNIWHWAAFRARDVEGVVDLVEGMRADVQAGSDQPPGLIEPSARADAVAARGMGLPREVQEGAIESRPWYADGRWHVVFVRELDPADDGGVALRPETSFQLSVAVWNGSAEDRGARKAISIWHELLLGH